MGKPSIGELDAGTGETPAEMPSKLTVLQEGSEETIYNLIFAVPGEEDKAEKGH